MPPFGLAPLEHVAPAGRAHPRPEPVTLLPPANLGLIGPFHTVPTIARRQNAGRVNFAPPGVMPRPVDNVGATHRSVHNFVASSFHDPVMAANDRTEPTRLPPDRNTPRLKLSTEFFTVVDNSPSPHLDCVLAHSRSAGSAPIIEEFSNTPPGAVHNNGYRLMTHGMS